MELPCIVRYVQYRSDNGFAILACDLDTFSAKYKAEMEEMIEGAVNEKYQTFPVSLGMLDPNEDPAGGQYVFVGDFATNPKYGRQFKAEFYYQDAPTTEDGLRAFLMTLPNIKESRSNAIIAKFGVEGTIDILENHPSDLTQISGINEKRIPSIIKAWQEKKYMRELFTFLTAHQIPMTWADKIFKTWGKDSLKIIAENPYRLVEIYGIGFVTADKIAHKVMKNIPAEYRITACMKFVLEESTWSNSNLCIPYSELKKNVVALIAQCDDELEKETDSQEVLKTIPLCLKNNLKIFAAIKDRSDGTVYVYMLKVLDREKFIASSLWRRKEFDHNKQTCSDKEIEDAEKNISSHNNRDISLDETQKNAIKSAFEHKVTIITGGGGTGKSTICRAIFYLAQKKGMSVRMMSPTGKAAQVLSEKTGCGASTIHRSLNIKPGEDEPKNRITEDIIVIDESSMSGIDTMYPILSALQENVWGNIVFVGDKNQLPSVSPGNFLADMIGCGVFNVVTLDKVHRQDENSYITILANDISKGKIVSIPKNASDIEWFNINPDSFKNDLLNFIDSYLANGGDMDDLQIISPMKKGLCGVFTINEIVQGEMAKRNDKTEDFMQRGFNKFYIGDKVIQIVNNYDKMVFNGDMGKIVEIGEKARDASVSDKHEKYVTVDFYGERMTYFGDDLDELHLAWGITVHKFQGSQSKHIVFIMAGEAQIMMSKELVYTAFTRAEKMLYIFGHQNMLRIAPTKSAIRKRYTNFTKFIDELKLGKKNFDVLG